jgi:hypothetical protein
MRINWSNKYLIMYKGISQVLPREEAEKGGSDVKPYKNAKDFKNYNIGNDSNKIISNVIPWLTEPSAITNW